MQLEGGREGGRETSHAQKEQLGSQCGDLTFPTSVSMALTSVNINEHIMHLYASPPDLGNN